MQKSPLEQSLTFALPRSCGGVLFGLLATTAFGVFFWFFCASLYLQTRATQSWTPTPCTILSSELVASKGRRPVTRLVVEYSYAVGSAQFRGNKYSVWMGPTTILYPYEMRRQLANRYSAGLKTNCYVNSRNPNEAVLDRDLPPSFNTFAPLLGAPLLVGVLVLLSSLMSLLRKKQ